MATKTFNVSIDAHVVYDPGLNGKGGGADHHIALGYNSGNIYRGLLKFTLDWTNVYSITSAVLWVKTSTGYSHGTRSAEDVYVRRNTSTWSEGSYGSDCYFYTANAVNWDNKPSYTSTGGVTMALTGSTDTWDSVTITNIVKAWAPTSVVGGGGASNYGITLRLVSETSGHFNEIWSSEEGSSDDAYITLTYETEPPQTNPTATKTTPLDNTLARISNMTDVTSSFSAEPELAFTYDDAEDHACSRYIVKVYDAATSGNLLYEYDTDDDSSYTEVAAGTTITHVVPNANASTGSTWHPSDGTDYWWTVEVWDNYETPGDSGESSRTKWRVRWGAARFYKNVGAGATAITVTPTPASTQANTQRQFLYQLSSDGAGGSGTGWVTSVASLPTPTVSTPYIEVYMRVCSDVSGTNPNIDKLVISYQAAGGQPLPDKWAYSEASPEDYFSLDLTERRYGSKCLKATDLGGFTLIYPTREVTDDNDIPVTPNTIYTFTCEIKTSGDLTSGNSIYLAIYAAGSETEVLAGSSNQSAPDENETLGTDPAINEGWERLKLTFTTGADTTRIRPAIVFYHDLGEDTFWIDGASLTEGSVAPAWAQGTVGASGTISAAGATLDGAQGAILRMRGSDGGLRDLVETGPAGLVFGGDVEVSAPTSGELTIDGDVAITGDAEITGDLTVTGGDLSLGSSGTIVAKEPVVTVYTSGSGNWTKPTGLLFAIVEVVGGGGGGGGHTPSSTSGHFSIGEAGGGGGYARKLYLASALGSTCAYVVGAGGSGGSTGDGGNGNTSSFAGSSVTVQATGGTGGTRGTDRTTDIVGSGNGGGVGSNGDINVKGSGSVPPIIISGYPTSGPGGSSALGGGAVPTRVSSGGTAVNGNAGGAYGGGGTGAGSRQSASQMTGGDGGDGVVIVTAYFGP